jgi:acyl carrier protein
MSQAAASPELHDQVLARLAETLRNVIGEDWALEVEIGRETSFNRDLELESIEFVALAEKLQEQYGARVDFTAWLGDMELEQIIALKVGEVVDFICRCLTSSEAA